MNSRFVCIAILQLTFAVALAEEPMAFKKRLGTPHLADRRDMSARVGSGEFAFRDGARFACCDDPLVKRGLEDFVDYLKTSMRLKDCGVVVVRKGTST